MCIRHLTDAVTHNRDMDLRSLIPVVPDFPKPGVGFLDITAVLHHPQAFDWCVTRLAGFAEARCASSVVAVESAVSAA